MHILEFDYELPEELIAQRPSEKRENSKMMLDAILLKNIRG